MHRGGDGAAFRRCQQQMDVVVHQDESMHLHAPCPACLAEKVAVVMAIGIIDEDRAAIDSALGHVQRNASKFETRSARHGVACADGAESFAWLLPQHDRRISDSDVGDPRSGPA